MDRMSRFGTTWGYAFRTIAAGAVLAAIGGLVIRFTHASQGWTYALIVGVTALTVLKLTLFNGSLITITIRITPPDAQR